MIVYRKFSAIAISLGSALAILMWGKGNQEIMALPLAFWLGVIFWPHSHRDDSLANTTDQRTVWRACVTIDPSLLAIVVWALVIARYSSAMPEGIANVRDVERQLDLADSLIREQRFQEGIATLEALSIPDNLPLYRARKHHNLGVVLLRLHRSVPAEEHLLLSLGYDRTNAQAAYLLGVIALQNHDLETAQRMVGLALSIDPSLKPALRMNQLLGAPDPKD